MKTFASILLLVLLGCASPPLATRSIDWQSAGEPWSIHIVTLDEDGGERVTRIWLAAADGVGALRTGDSRWWANLLRDPICRIRLGGVEYPVRAEIVTNPVEKARIDEVFLEKYGRWERMMFPQERGETHENYARLRAIEASQE